MHTYHIGVEEVRQYLLDFFEKIQERKDIVFPDVFCPIGESGLKLIELLQKKEFGSLLEKFSINKTPLIKLVLKDGSVVGISEEDKNILANAKTILLIDSAIHRGSSMHKCYRAIESAISKVLQSEEKSKPNIVAYSLVMKRSAVFVPNYVGMIMDSHDRAYFLLDKIPSRPIIKHGIVRVLEEDDLSRQDIIKTETPQMKAPTWGDCWYSMITGKAYVYVHEFQGKIDGVLRFFINGDSLFIDSLAVDKDSQGQKIGGALVHWVRCFARSTRCSRIHLLAVEDAVTFYDKSGYKKTGRKMILDGVKHFEMERKIIYDYWSTFR